MGKPQLHCPKKHTNQLKHRERERPYHIQLFTAATQTERGAISYIITLKAATQRERLYHIQLLGAAPRSQSIKFMQHVILNLALDGCP